MREFPKPTGPPRDGEAVELPPWREPAWGPAAERGPVRVWLYGPDRAAGLWVYTAGRWRLGRVWARHDQPDGQVAYQVAIEAPDEAGNVVRTYLWGPDSVRPAYSPDYSSDADPDGA